MQESSKEVIRVLDKMAEAGWISRSASADVGAIVAWTPSGQACMELLRKLMFDDLKL